MYLFRLREQNLNREYKIIWKKKKHGMNQTIEYVEKTVTEYLKQIINYWMNIKKELCLAAF